MKFTIITVCLNSVATIRETIESVLGQTYQDIEYIVIDGKSSDGSQSIIGEYSHHISHYISEPDEGIYDAMNKGILQASGDVIGFLNSDDIYLDQTVISSVANKFEEKVDVVFGDLIFVRPDNLRKVVRYCSASRFKPWKLRFGWMPPHPSTFVKKAVYDKLGRYITDYKIAADYEFMVRMLYCQTVRYRYRYLDTVIVRMRTGGVSTRSINSALLLKRETVRACRENGLYTNLFFLAVKFPCRLGEFIRLKLKPPSVTGF